MKIVFLDGQAIRERADLFRAFEKALDLPWYAGRNLDALWDQLSSTREEIGVILVNSQAFQRRFEPLSHGFLTLMRDLEAKRPGFHFCRDPFGGTGA